jgi:hypothetical protein
VDDKFFSGYANNCDSRIKTVECSLTIKNKSNSIIVVSKVGANLSEDAILCVSLVLNI